MSAAVLVIMALARLIDPSPAEVARLEAFAAEVERAIDAAPALPFEGPAARDGAIAALLVTAAHESGFRPAVVDCIERGDNGRSVTAWQLLGPFGRNGHTIAEVCGSVELAAGAALRVLTLHPKCTPLGMWRAYASGSCSVRSRAADEMCAAWVRATVRLGIVGASCWAKRPLEWADPS